MEQYFQLYRELLDAGYDDPGMDALFQKQGLDLRVADIKKMFDPQSQQGSQIIDQATESAFTEPDYSGMDLSVEGFLNNPKTIGAFRSILQGGTFGSADELEAALRSVSTDQGRDYNDILKQVRSELYDYQEKNPGQSLAFEAGASFLAPSFILGKILNNSKLAVEIGEGLVSSALKRVAAGSIAGGTSAATYGTFAADPDPDLPLGESLTQRAVTGALDAPIGMATGSVTPAIQKGAEKVLSGVGSIASKVGQKVGLGGGGKGPPPRNIDGSIPEGGEGAPRDKSRTGMQFVLRSMERDGVQIQDLFDLLDERIQLNLGRNVTLSELLGRQGQNMAMVAARAPGVGPQLARDAFQDIGQQTRKQAESSIFRMDSTKPTPKVKDYFDEKDPKSFLSQLTNEAFKKSRPFYDSADPVEFWDDYLAKQINDALKRDDSVGKAIREALKEARGTINIRQSGADRKYDPYEIWTDEIDSVKPIQHWDELAKAIDDELKNIKALNPGKQKARQQIEEIRNLITQTLAQKNENYARGQAIYAKKNAMYDAFKAGKLASENKVNAVSAKSMLQKLKTPAEKNYFRLGFAQKFYEKISKTNVQNPDPKSIIGAYSLENQDKINNILGKDNAEKFFKRFDILKNRASIASQTQQGSITELLNMTKQDMQLDPTMMQRAQSVAKSAGNPMQTLGTFSDQMAAKRLEGVTEGMSPLLFNVGPRNTREGITRLAREQQRLQNLQRFRNIMTGATPGTLAPIIQNQDPANFYGLLMQ